MAAVIFSVSGTVNLNEIEVIALEHRLTKDKSYYSCNIFNYTLIMT